MAFIPFRVQQAKEALRDLSLSPDVARKCFDELSAEELRYFELGLINANFRTVLPNTVHRHSVTAIAEECTRRYLWGGWEYYSFFARLSDQCNANTSEPPLQQLQYHPLTKCDDLSVIDKLIEHGSGVLICSFHFGHFRFLPTALALRGFNTVCALDSSTYESTNGLIEAAKSCIAALPACKDTYANLRNIHFIDVRDPTTTLRLARALHRGAVVVLFVDGNRGTDSTRGVQARETIKFFDRNVFVKNGAARIAASAKAPLLAVAACRGEHEDRPAVGSPIFVEDNPSSITCALQEIYAFFERQILLSPENWEGVRLLHQWQPLSESNERQAIVPDGIRVRFAGGRIELRQTDNRIVWMDLALRTAYSPPIASDQAAALFCALSNPVGTDISAATAGLAHDVRNKVLLMLGHMLCDGAICVV